MVLPENLHNCPAITAAVERANQLQAGLDQLNENTAQRRAGTDAWKTEFANASPEERQRDMVIDGDSVGNMYRGRDTYDMFARLASRSDGEQRADIEHKQRILAQKVEARQEACPKGPGRRAMCLGAATCRSTITGDGLPNGTLRESFSKHYGS